MRRLRDSQRPIHALNKRLRINSDHDSRERGDAESSAHSKTDIEPLAHYRLAHKDRVRNLQVIIESEQNVEHRDRGKHVVPTFYEAQKDVVLAKKSSRGRN